MSSIIIIALLLLLFVLFIYILYLKLAKKYTRERFAFYCVASITFIFSSIILQIYSSQGYISATVNTLNFLFHTSIATYHTDIKDHIITFIFFIPYMRFLSSMYKNWDGPISETLHNKRQFQESTTMLREATLQLKDFLSKEKTIVPYAGNGKDKHHGILMLHEDDQMPWHENVFELLTFPNKQYKINLQEDYYPDERCFISNYGQTDEKIAILCSIDYPGDDDIKKFTHFLKKRNGPFYKIIIAIKKHRGEIETINRYDTAIEVRNEHEMLYSLIDLSSYQQFICDQFTNHEITAGNEYKLKDIYVPLTGKNDNNEFIGETESYVTDWLNGNKENKHLAILGEYGCGKSVLSLKITYELLQNRSQYTRIPILIELRGKSPRNLNVTEIFSTWASAYRLDPASLMKLHKAGKLLIIFEGFDEMDMIGDREMRLNHFQRLWEFAIPKSKIIITGRPNFFLDDKELKINLCIDKPYEAHPYCEAIHLEKFNIQQIKAALRNIDPNTRDQVIEILEKSKSSIFYDLVSRPAILYLVAVIWKERRLSEMKDNINSAVVISEFIKYSYSRQSSKKNIISPLSEKEREYFMIGIAVGMLWTTEFSNQINKADLENIILKLYRNFPEEFRPVENALQASKKPLRERMIDNKHDEDSILTDVRSCGILVKDPTRIDYFKFAHKSFLEYQVSQYFVESILQDKGGYNIIMNAITKALDITVSNFNHSKETMSFTAEILTSKSNLDKWSDTEILCKKLFSTLCSNKFLGKYPYIAATFEMYGFKVFLTATLLAPLFFMTHLIFDQSPLLLMGIITATVSFTVVMAKSAYGYNFKRAVIWLKCCEQLMIPYSIITKVVPARYIPFLKGYSIKNPFTIILREMRRDMGIKNDKFFRADLYEHTPNPMVAHFTQEEVPVSEDKKGVEEEAASL